MSEHNPVWAAIIGIGVVVLLYFGVYGDMKAIPPSFGARCNQAYDELLEQASIPEVLPPPGKTGSGESGLPYPESLALFNFDELPRRVGYDHTGAKNPEIWSRRLGAGWYIDWQGQRRYPTQKPEHWQMIRLGKGCISPNPDAIRWVASRYQGSVWIIGNEPDNIWQDNILPEEYAQVYHDLYVLIKDADPKASIAVGGVTQGTALRLAYLDRVLTAYEANYHHSMPVDWWTVHGFVLREERGNWGAEIPPGFSTTLTGELYEVIDTGSVAYFQKQIIDFRSWMAERGYQDKPLAISEFGILLSELHGFTPEMVAAYLLETFTWLDQANDDQIGYPQDDYRLVQRWAWFSLYDKLYYTSNLGNVKADALTNIGWAFREFVQERSP